MSGPGNAAAGLLGGRGLAILAILAVAAAVATALALIEGPSEVRARRLDELRVRDLGALAAKIDCHWTLERALPPDLRTLETRMAQLGGQKPLPPQCAEPNPAEPDSGASYGYRVLGGQDFELCAEFLGRSSKRPEPLPPPRASERNWTHTAGRQCFVLEAAEVEMP